MTCFQNIKYFKCLMNQDLYCMLSFVSRLKNLKLKNDISIMFKNFLDNSFHCLLPFCITVAIIYICQTIIHFTANINSATS